MLLILGYIFLVLFVIIGFRARTLEYALGLRKVQSQEELRSVLCWFGVHLVIGLAALTCIMIG